MSTTTTAAAATTHGAREMVLELPELLEELLLHLSPRDMLVAQRVARRWREVAFSSPIQRALFLQPTTSQLDSIAFFVRDATASLKLWNMDYSDLRPAKDLTSQDAHCPAVLFNPLLGTPAHARIGQLRQEQMGIIDVSRAAHLFDDLNAPDVCMDMFLTQPPTSCVEIALSVRTKELIPKEGVLHTMDFPMAHEVNPATTICCGEIVCHDCYHFSFLISGSPNCPKCDSSYPHDAITSEEKWVDINCEWMIEADGGVKLHHVLEFLDDWFQDTQSKLPEQYRAIASKVGVRAFQMFNFNSCKTFLLSPYEWEFAQRQVWAEEERKGRRARDAGGRLICRKA